ncbi:MAG: MoaD/ThiS family protein [Phycisphaerae bacterium]|nr:MoaD/ThiS family protein [Phycisphaerae bacterium]MCZ2398720.1 MoaD/ThiS family protein [Phycisphaerae bacterium]NUQ49650.1 MoaD/ThiS family protein [Phycisphaerae bacterium]
MPRIAFTHHLERHVSCPAALVPGSTVAEVLDAFFAENQRLRGYVLDDQGCVRKHVTIFVDGRPIRDRDRLSDAVAENAEIYVMQALSGG